jgi:hypothetical protein
MVRWSLKMRGGTEAECRESGDCENANDWFPATRHVPPMQ